MIYVSVVLAVAVSAAAVSASAWQLGLGKPEPLYSPTDPIALLDVNTLKRTVLGSDKAWLVEFYSSWCGHCQHFAPTFKTLAAEVKGNGIRWLASLELNCQSAPCCT
jgi:thiol-disulfide isomerase/thioredoxin